jgi:predicted Rossmann fold flavoprotein
LTDAPAEVWPVAIVGAGAAGLLAAIFAARGGVEPLLLETRPTPGAKIRVSGGGRCNLLPSRLGLDDFSTEGSRRALRNVLFSWPLDEVRAFFERDHGIALEVEASGKIFPRSDDAREVVAALLRESARVGVTLRGGFRVVGLRHAEGGAFVLDAADGRSIRARRVVLATGGLSLPKTGSDGGGYALARSLGHGLAPTFPALVPLLSSDPRWTALAGVSCRARLRAVRDAGDAERILEERAGDLLFTHRGFSGPLVLDMSHHVTRPGSDSGTRLVLGFAAEAGDGGLSSWDERLRLGRGTVGGVLRRALPRRLADEIASLAAVSPEQALAELTRPDRQSLTKCLDALPLPVAGSEGYRTAEVTGGGIPLSEVSLRTLESRIAPGLYLAGEMLDAFGRIGGYNFLWAWVTGRKVGLALAEACAADQGASKPLPGT